MSKKPLTEADKYARSFNYILRDCEREVARYQKEITKGVITRKEIINGWLSTVYSEEGLKQRNKEIKMEMKRENKKR
jgi:hypothetical protein